MQSLSRDQVHLHIDADAQTLYSMVSDVTRTPEWSPEVVACRWIDGATAPAVGARFRARNKLRWFTWSNSPVVVTADPGREFAFSRSERGGGDMLWRYRFEPAQTGTTVIESYEVTRPVPTALSWMLRIVLGVRDHGAHLNAGMRTSLLRLKDAAEREVRDRPASFPSSTT
ncbi:MAG: SRPBCC family protein [Actinomycetota bacterium]|nr:SRPBCC family protein [Actinomycetota bacterium]